MYGSFRVSWIGIYTDESLAIFANVLSETVQQLLSGQVAAVVI